MTSPLEFQAAISQLEGEPPNITDVNDGHAFNRFPRQKLCMPRHLWEDLDELWKLTAWETLSLMATIR